MAGDSSPFRRWKRYLLLEAQLEGNCIESEVPENRFLVVVERGTLVVEGGSAFRNDHGMK